MPSSTSLFSDIANTILNGMGTDLFSKSGNLINGIAPIFQIGFGIYILLVALNYYNRGFDENIVDLGKRLVGWMLIIAFAFNSSQYQKLANIMWMLPENLSSLMGTSTYTASALDTASNNIWEMFENITAYASEIWNPADKAIAYIGGLIAVFLAYIFFSVYFCLLPDNQTVVGNGYCHRTTVYRLNAIPCDTPMGNELDRSDSELLRYSSFLCYFGSVAKCIFSKLSCKTCN